MNRHQSERLTAVLQLPLDTDTDRALDEVENLRGALRNAEIENQRIKKDLQNMRSSLVSVAEACDIQDAASGSSYALWSLVEDKITALKAVKEQAAKDLRCVQTLSRDLGLGSSEDVSQMTLSILHDFERLDREITEARAKREGTNQKYLEILGLRVRDKVSGLEGTATSVCFDLYGCIQCIVLPRVGEDNKPAEPSWFDYSRLEVLSEDPVMDVPKHFLPNKGPAEKPARRG
jgi:hypothetical protein